MENVKSYLANVDFAKDENLVRGCFSPQNSLEFESAFSLYKTCVEFFPNVLPLRLLEFYLNHGDTCLKTKALQLVCFSLSISDEIAAYALADMKPLLLSCFRESSRLSIEREMDFMLLRNIGSYVTNYVFKNNLTWPELSYCLNDLANSEPLLGFYIFLDLPTTSLGWDFLVPFCKDLQAEAMKTVQKQEYYGSEEVIAAFGTLVYIGLHLSGPHINDDCTLVLDVIGDAKRTLLEDTFYQSINELARLLKQNIQAYSYYPNQKAFVFRFACQMIRTSLPVETQVALLEMLEIF